MVEGVLPANFCYCEGSFPIFCKTCASPPEVIQTNKLDKMGQNRVVSGQNPYIYRIKISL